jgi:homoserine kinase
MLKDDMFIVRAFAPASVANCIVGYDILGFSFDLIGDIVELKRTKTDLKIVMLESEDEIPSENDKNIVTILLLKIANDLGFKCFFDVTIKKGIPVSSGLGGSAASIVACLVAINHFLKKPLSKNDLLKYAAWAEGQISGAEHLDNALPSMFGGFCLLNLDSPSDFISLPIPENLYAVIVHPNIKIETKYSREVIKEELSIQNMVQQSSNLARFMSFLYGKENGKVGRFSDYIAEPYRKSFLIGFNKLKEDVFKAGSIGFSFSGSGPSLLAFTTTENDASKVNATIVNHLNDNRIKNKGWVYKLNNNAAKILEEIKY